MNVNITSSQENTGQNTDRSGKKSHKGFSKFSESHDSEL
jgi:hypothetical protein